MTAHVVLVHGLFDGGWVWEDVTPRLAAAGVPCSTPDLPLTTLDADVEALTSVLERADTPVVLVGHSYGGAVITVAGAHPAVRELMYVAAFQLAAGERISRVLPERGIAPSPMDLAMRGMVRGEQVVPDPPVIREVIYNRTPADVADAAIARMRPVSKALFRGEPAEVAWHARPSTYVVCTDDRTVAPDLQRAMAERASRVVELDSDHSPMTCRTAELTDVVVEVSARH
jgi:pimeloyl-ACP methyl ester carboxylesterase